MCIRSFVRLASSLCIFSILLGSDFSLAANGGAPDIVFFNGKFITVNRGFGIARALAVRDGRIVGVGDQAAIRKLAAATTQFVDLRGRTVLPGFYDAHVHLRIGPGANVLDLRTIKTRPELDAQLRQAGLAAPSNAWVNALLGFEWSETNLPDRWALDQLVSGHPVVIMAGAHMMLVNSQALRLAKIDAATADPPGGKIVRNNAGQPNGWLMDAASWRSIWALVPWAYPTDEAARGVILDQLKSWLAHGITSANVAGVRPYDRDDPYRYVDMPAMGWIQQLYASNGVDLPRLTIQLRLYPGFEEHQNPSEDGVRAAVSDLESFGLHTGFGNERLKIGAVKLSLDGGDAGWTSESYKDRPGYAGAVRIPEPVLYQVAKRAKQLGWQLGIHTMGDAAVEEAVNVLERIYREIGPGEYRDYLHHVAVLPSQEILRRMAALNIAVCSQPNFLTFKPLLEALEGERLARVSPQRSLLTAGLRVGYGSDSVPYGPLYGIWSAVTRTGIYGMVSGPDERVSLQEAIRRYTLGSAYLTFDEQTRGSLEVGKVADMVVLDGDILGIPPMQIKDLRVIMTIIGGRIVYAADRHTQTSPAVH